MAGLRSPAGFMAEASKTQHWALADSQLAQYLLSQMSKFPGQAKVLLSQGDSCVKHSDFSHASAAMKIIKCSERSRTRTRLDQTKVGPSNPATSVEPKAKPRMTKAVPHTPRPNTSKRAFGGRLAQKTA